MIFRAVLYTLVFPAVIAAHGVEASLIEGGTLNQTVRFNYSTGESMIYARICVYPPSTPDTDVLQGTTDRNGLFSFTPDEAGLWRVTAEDGMGHKSEIAIEAGQPVAAASHEARRMPLLFAVFLGLSLIANVWLLWYFFLKKMQRRVLCAH
ncbi:MAG: carboxypeptidase-like regulatory domain-containing protein [Spirochaetaceae bacterium]|nr:carboxypeptidase-like regulatory domain-containing protein [Spirochaetaceae bacterium]